MYSFGVPNILVYLSHIIIGSILMYSGYLALHNNKLSKNLSVLLIVLGVIAALYHGHLWVLN
jgi:hypothetical protein